MPIVKFGKSAPKSTSKAVKSIANRKPNPDSAAYKKLKAAVNRGKRG